MASTYTWPGDTTTNLVGTFLFGFVSKCIHNTLIAQIMQDDKIVFFYFNALKCHHAFIVCFKINSGNSQSGTKAHCDYLKIKRDIFTSRLGRACLGFCRLSCWTNNN